MKTTLLICANLKECDHFLNDYIQTPTNEDRDFRMSAHQREAVSDLYQERVIARTPDEVEKILGIEINDIFVKGEANKHPKFDEFYDEAMRRFKR